MFFISKYPHTPYNTVVKHPLARVASNFVHRDEVGLRHIRQVQSRYMPEPTSPITRIPSTPRTRLCLLCTSYTRCGLLRFRSIPLFHPKKVKHRNLHALSFQTVHRPEQIYESYRPHHSGQRHSKEHSLTPSHASLLGSLDLNCPQSPNPRPYPCPYASSYRNAVSISQSPREKARTSYISAHCSSGYPATTKSFHSGSIPFLACARAGQGSRLDKLAARTIVRPLHSLGMIWSWLLTQTTDEQDADAFLQCYNSLHMSRPRGVWSRELGSDEAHRQYAHEFTTQRNAARRRRYHERGQTVADIARKRRNYQHTRLVILAKRRAFRRTAEGRVRMSHDDAVRRSRMTPDGTITPDFLSELLAKQKNRCALCPADISEHRHLDHKVPLAKGGKHTASNVHYTCPPCNLRKGTRTLHKFSLPYRVGYFFPSPPAGGRIPRTEDRSGSGARGQAETRSRR